MIHSGKILQAATLFTTALLLNSACSNDDKKVQSCQLTKTTTVSTGYKDADMNGTDVSSFTYDADGNLTKYTLYDDEITFTYKEGIITKQTAKEGNIEVWSYNDKKLVNHIDGTFVGTEDIYTKDFTYDDKGKLLTIKRLHNSNTDYLMSFMYSGSDVTGYVITDLNNNNAVIGGGNYSNYDDKNNPYLLLAKATGNQSFFITEITSPQVLSKHNVKTFDDLDLGKATVTYEYDGSGNVTKMTSTYESGGKDVTTLEYACK